LAGTVRIGVRLRSKATSPTNSKA